MNNYFKKNGWKQLPGEIGSNGIDGLFVKRNKAGIIKEVMIADTLIASIISKSEILDSQTGRIIGDLYAGIILNDNFSLINEIYSLLDVSTVAFLANNKTIASYDLDNDEVYKKFDDIKIAVLDKKRCAKFSQILEGDLSKNKIAIKENIAATFLSPISGIFESAGKLLGGCEQFYFGKLK